MTLHPAAIALLTVDCDRNSDRDRGSDIRASHRAIPVGIRFGKTQLDGPGPLWQRSGSVARGLHTSAEAARTIEFARDWTD